MMTFDIKTLEFNKIRQAIDTYAHTTRGKLLIAELFPMTDRQAIEKNLTETAEAKRFIEEGLEPSFGGIYDIRDAVKRAKIEGILSIKELLDIKGLIEASKRIKRELTRLKERTDETVSIEQYGEELIVLKALSQAIYNVINDAGEIRDSASTELSRIRRAIDINERNIKQALDQVLKKEAKKLTEQIITMRMNRYVVPVKLSEKNNIKGTILDYSSSGETAYVEPEMIRNLTSKNEALFAEEKREIEKILYILTIQVKDDSDSILENASILAHLDHLFAKAMYGHHTESTKPIFGERIHIIKARHPLIPKDEVVANTITFDKDVKTMIITGSNTGGKTVTLKTIGLIAMMAQSGCLIPAIPGSELICFDQIRADIGDEQSIEQSLSTFSSHMKNIVSILNETTPNSLILLDELGSGTDPNEGASLGMSILEFLSQKSVYVMATTHYPELKAYAYTKPSIVNASVEFDKQTLKPTYRLLLRTPGESHALLIAERLGLNKSIIEDAQKRVLTSENEVSALIDNLKNESHKLDQLLTENESTRNRLENELKEAKLIRKKLQNEAATLRDRIVLENKHEIDQLKAEAQSILKDLEALKDKNFKAHEIADLKYRIRNLSTPDETGKETPTEDHIFKPKDKVYVIKYNRYGELVEKQKNKQWVVQMGALTSVFKESEIRYAEDQSKRQVSTQNKQKSMPKKAVSSELDLRGMRAHEAEDAVVKYLDDCLVADLPFASIIHGFGTLALRKLVKQLVSEHPAVISHRDGKGNEGGQGVTIVYFK